MQRKQLKYPDDWEPVIQAHCEQQSLTWSEFVRDAILSKLPPKISRDLSEVDRVGRPANTK